MLLTGPMLAQQYKELDTARFVILLHIAAPFTSQMSEVHVSAGALASIYLFLAIMTLSQMLTSLYASGTQLAQHMYSHDDRCAAESLCMACSDIELSAEDLLQPDFANHCKFALVYEPLLWHACAMKVMTP